MTKVTGPGVPDMKKLAAELKVADPALRRNLRKQFRDIARPIVRDVQAAIIESPSAHHGELRKQIAGTVSANVSFARSGVALNIVSRGAKMPPGKDTLPAHMNDDKRFHHPVYGRPEAEAAAMSLGAGKGGGHGRGWTWVRQFSHANGWFDQTIAHHAPQAQRAAEAAMEDTKRQLEH